MTVDANPLNAVIQEHIRLSSRLPEIVVTSAAYHVVKRAIELTPFVPVSRIDEELNVVVAVKIGRSGQPLSPRYSKNVMKLGGVPSGWGMAKQVPLTVLIIMARTRHDSNYNRRTNWRWELPSHFFQGMSRGQYAATMRAMENRMINARHSSIKFLIAGWVAVRNQLRSLIYGGPPDLEGAGQAEDKDFGRALFTKQPGICYVTIENLIGMAAGSSGDNSANYNQALFEHGLVPLQRAIDEEAESQAVAVARKYELEKIAPLWKKI